MLLFAANTFRIISRCIGSLPCNVGNKAALAKYAFTYFYKIGCLIIINTNKNHTIICQQIFCQFQPRINHIEPIRMESAITLGVGHKAVAFFIILTAIIHIVRRTLGKIVLIDKIIAGVVRRINVDHLDLAQIGFLQELQHFQIISLDVEVFTVKTAGCAIFANAVCHHRTQRCRDGRICRQHCLFLVRPCKLVTLFPTLHDGIGKLLPQNVKINGVFYFAVAFYLGNGVGK